MKLLETLTDEQKLKLLLSEPVGIFETLFASGDPWYKATGDCCSGYYLQHSGGKTISPAYVRVYELYDSTQTKDPSLIIGSMVRAKFIDKWKRVYKALNLDYDFLNTYQEHIKKSGSNNDTTNYNNTVSQNGSTSTHEQTTRSTDNTDDVYGFNSVSSVPDTKSNEKVTETVEGDGSKNTTQDTRKKTGEDSKVGSFDEDSVREGYEGQPSDIIKKEIMLRNSEIFFDIIYHDIDSIAVLQIYV